MSTTIEWCDETWNPTVGCTRVSDGCDRCYAIGVAHRGLSPRHRGLTKVRPPGARRPGVDWTGDVRLVHEAISRPLRWRKRRRVFVNSMSDLFHERVPDHFIDSVFAVMLITSLHECRGGHTYLLLTKRPESALVYLTAPALAERLAKEAGQMMEDGDGWHDAIWNHVREHGPTHKLIHLGVSAEDQAAWDKRVPLLLECPASVRWVSIEPQLGPIDMRGPVFRRGRIGTGRMWADAINHLDWIVCGGESGPGARPFDVAWARSIIDQCQEEATPVFIKQLGSQPRMRPRGKQMVVSLTLVDRKGGDPSEWPADLRVREYPEVTP